MSAPDVSPSLPPPSRDRAALSAFRPPVPTPCPALAERGLSGAGAESNMAFSVAVPTNDEKAEALIAESFASDPGARCDTSLRHVILSSFPVLVPSLAETLACLILQPERQVRLDRRGDQGRRQPSEPAFPHHREQTRLPHPDRGLLPVSRKQQLQAGPRPPVAEAKRHINWRRQGCDGRERRRRDVRDVLLLGARAAHHAKGADWLDTLEL